MDLSTLRDLDLSEDTTMQVQKPTLAASEPSYMPQWGSDEHIESIREFLLESMRKARHPMGKPADSKLPQGKSIDAVLSKYIHALSKKKHAVLALAGVQVECEDAEAVLLEAYGIARLKEVRDSHYVTDDPESATGRYFDAVSDIRFDPLEMYQEQ